MICSVQTDHIASCFKEAVFYKFYLVHSWVKPHLSFVSYFVYFDFNNQFLCFLNFQLRLRYLSITPTLKQTWDVNTCSRVSLLIKLQAWGVFLRFPVFRWIRRLLGREMIASLIFGIRPLPFTWKKIMGNRGVLHPSQTFTMVLFLW